MLCSSFTFGIRQSLCPPSPVPPSVLTCSSQSQIVPAAASQKNVQVTSWLPWAVAMSRIFCSHMSPVFRSVMVPSPLFWYLSAPPARTTPSSRTGASVVFRVGGNEVVCPVAGKVLAPQLDDGSLACTAVADSPSPTSNARLKMLFMVLISRSRQYRRWIAWPYRNKTMCNERVPAGSHQDYIA